MAIEALITAARENPVTFLIALLVPVLLLAIQHAVPNNKKSLVNLTVQKDVSKVVTKIDCSTIEQDPNFSGGKLVMCRCWRSKKFPYCDGSHAAHNKETGDNVGPLIIEKSSK